MSKRLFVDMDGTLAEFKEVDTLETLYEPGYFLNLKPHMSVVDAVKNIIEKDPAVDVYVLSAYLSDSKYALEEKNKWLDLYIPEIDSKHRLFCTCGDDKREFIAGTLGDVRSDDFLLDDYSHNLHSWEPPAIGIKLMNGINGNHGTWTKAKVSFDKDPAELSQDIKNIILSSGVNQAADQTDDIGFRRKHGR